MGVSEAVYANGKPETYLMIRNTVSLCSRSSKLIFLKYLFFVGPPIGMWNRIILRSTWYDVKWNYLIEEVSPNTCVSEYRHILTYLAHQPPSSRVCILDRLLYFYIYHKFKEN
ncbi:MAG: hypothetical protein UV60_C0006G0086 [Parcubacteria group bacterium GW2011_GWA2_43_11]|nr:MAG: hypothetical protein UV60_C0006G0086 [Parcubacteria group bacterium GW2011_GWA2_43_11]